MAYYERYFNDVDSVVVEVVRNTVELNIGNGFLVYGRKSDRIRFAVCWWCVSGRVPFDIGPV